MEHLEQLIRTTIAENEAAGTFPLNGGVAVAVLRPGAPAQIVTHGLRERDRNLPITANTRFELCSLTKAFTAATTLSLSLDRGVSLDKPLVEQTGNFKFSDDERTKAVTIRDILAQRVAIPAHDLFWYLTPRTPQEIREALPKMQAIQGGFRKTFVYGNIMYGLLGHSFEDLFGVSWRSAVESHLLSPLGWAGDSLTDKALPYVVSTRGRDIDCSCVAAAGDIRGSISELANWLTLWLNGGKTPDGKQLVPEGCIEEALSPQMPAADVNPLLLSGLEWIDRSNLSYGFGWFLGAYANNTIAFHPGLIDGYTHLAAILPSKSSAVAVLCNVNFSTLPGKIAHALMQSLSGETYEKKDPPSSQQHDWVGRYTNPLFGECAVVGSSGNLLFEYAGHKWPLNELSAQSGQVIATAFGLQIPLEVKVEMINGSVQLHVPLAMDPRIEPAVFTKALLSA